MSDGMRDELERQVERLLEEAERPMRVEEILPHLDPVMPTPNDVAHILETLASEKRVDREGSFFGKATPVPVESLFKGEAEREAARAVVEIIRELDAGSEGEGARFPYVMLAAKRRGIPSGRVLDVVTILRNAGEAYSVGGDRLRLAKP
jgi:hypothetical protein